MRRQQSEPPGPQLAISKTRTIAFLSVLGVILSPRRTCFASVVVLQNLDTESDLLKPLLMCDHDNLNAQAFGYFLQQHRCRFL
jgi:hypothetical protein